MKTSPAVALLVASCISPAWLGCSGSSSGATTKDDAGDHPDAHAESATCPSMPACTGSLSGGVSGALATCSLSPLQGGTKLGFGEVTFSFTADGASGQVTGSGNVSTKGEFAPGTYVSDGGLWNDTGSTGTAADSLWTVTWGSYMAECNGIHSPDEIDSLCADAALDITSIDSCNIIHGTFDTTVPAYMATPAVNIHLSF